jgi:hypothetical protein
MVQQYIADHHIEVDVDSISNQLDIHQFYFFVDRYRDNMNDIDFHDPHTNHSVDPYLKRDLFSGEIWE